MGVSSCCTVLRVAQHPRIRYFIGLVRALADPSSLFRGLKLLAQVEDQLEFFALADPSSLFRGLKHDAEFGGDHVEADRDSRTLPRYSED